VLGGCSMLVSTASLTATGTGDFQSGPVLVAQLKVGGVPMVDTGTAAASSSPLTGLQTSGNPSPSPPPPQRQQQPLHSAQHQAPVQQLQCNRRSSCNSSSSRAYRGVAWGARVGRPCRGSTSRATPLSMGMGATHLCCLRGYRSSWGLVGPPQCLPLSGEALSGNSSSSSSTSRSSRGSWHWRCR